MDASALNVQGAAMLAQSAQTRAPAAANNAEVAAKTSKEFESVFISHFLGSMFQGISTDGPTGGGQGEEMFRSLMIDQYGKSIEQRGGFGLATAVQRQLLKHQEVPAPTSAILAPASVN